MSISKTYVTKMRVEKLMFKGLEVQIFMEWGGEVGGVGWSSEWGELTFKLRVRCMARYVEEVLQMQWGRFRC